MWFALHLGENKSTFPVKASTERVSTNWFRLAGSYEWSNAKWDSCWWNGAW